jgi:autotransporter-associated beta strand protein
VNNGTLRPGNTNALSRFSNINLATAGTLDLAGINVVTGSITGTGLVTNNSGTGVNLATGFDNTSFTFSGRFGSANQTSTSFNLNKIGTGTMTIDSAAGTGTMSIGTFTTSQGTSVLSGAAGSTKFVTYTLPEGGTLILDNSGANLNNRLGGTDFAVGAALVRNITLQGGEFKIIGNAGAATVETLNLGTVGAIGVQSGGSIITLDANAAQSLTLNAGNIANLSGGGALLIRGDNLGAAPGNGVANLFAPSVGNFLGGATGNGSNTISIRPDIIADTSATGLGTAFATYSAIGGVRPLAATELAPGLFRVVSTVSNVAVNSAQTYGSLSVNSLTISGASALTAIRNESVLSLQNSGGLLVLDASGTDFTGGLIQSGGNQFILHQLDSGNTLDFNAQVLGSNGFIKTGAGALSFNKQQFFTTSSQLTINNGLLTLNSGVDNTLTVIPTNTTPTLLSVAVNDGTLDLNGRNQAVSRLNNNTPALAGAAGIVTNSSGTAALLTVADMGSTTFSGEITGNLSYTRSGNSTTTLTSDNTYTGATTIRNGVLNLQDQGKLSGTTGITNYFGGLTLNDSGLYVVSNRVGATPITMQGGTLTYIGVQSGATVGAITLNGGAGLGGANTITVTPATGTVAPSTLTIADLLRTTAGTTVNFTGNNLGLGGTNNSQVILTQVNTAAITLDDGMLGGWATVNGTDFAGYIAPSGTSGGVGALGTTGYPAYSAAALTAGTATDNITVAASVSGVTARTINSLRVSAVSTITLTGALVIDSGGLLLNGAASNITGSTITAGAGNELFAYTNNTATIASVITGAGTGLVKSGVSTLTLTGNNSYLGGTVVNQGILTLSTAASNGTSTVAIPAGTLTINNASVTQTVAGTIHNTSPIVINGAGVLTLTGANTLGGLITFNNSGGVNPGVQVASLANSTTVANSATVTVSSTAGLWAGQLVTGGSIPANTFITNIVSATQFTISQTTPTAATNVTVVASNVAPTISTGGLLTLGSNINVTNDNFSYTPIIGGTVALGGATRTITTAGLSPNSLLVPAVISGAGATNVLNLAGTGSVTLSGASTFGIAGSTSINLQGGSLIIGADSTPSTVGATITASPLGLGTLVITDGAKILAGGVVAGTRTVANPITANTQLTFGVAQQNLTLNGTVSFGTANPTITVENNFAGNSQLTMALGASFGSAGGFNSFTKAGPGLLAINATSNNSLTGTITVNDGWLQVGSQYALGGSLYTAGPAVTINGGSYNNNVANVFVQNAVNYTANGLLSATQGSTAIGPVTMGAGSTALGIQGGQFNTIFGGLTMNGTTATTLFATNTLNVLGTFGGSTPSVTKQGVTSNLVLGGASTYAGNIIVDMGGLESRVGSSTPANEQLTSAGTITVNPGALIRVLSAANIGATATTVNTNNDGIGAFGLGYNGALPGSVTFATTSGTVDGTLGIDVVGYSTAVDLGALGPNNRVFLGSTSGGNYTATTLGVGTGNTYRLGTGGSTLQINSPVLTGANSVIIGAVTGTPGANLIGNGGTVILNTANSYTGGTTINGNANLRIGNAGALGSGAISFNSGQLEVNQTGLGVTTTVGLLRPMTITNDINFSGTGVLSALAGSGTTIGAFAADAFIGAGPQGQIDLTLSGAVDLAGATYRALSIAGTDRIVTLSGKVTGSSSLVKTGVGILRLTNATNDYTGDTVVSQGTLLLAPAGIPGASTVKLNSGVLANWNSSLTLGNNVQLIQNSTIDVGAATTLTSTGTISGDFTYVGAQTGLTKTGLGTLVLSGVNTYLGATTINGGVLSISADNNLGSVGGLSVLPGGVTFGVAGGHLAVTATNTSNRVLTMTAAGSINVAAGQTYTNNALTAGAGLLTINGPGTVILNGNQTGANLHDNTAISNGATLMTQATAGTPFGDVAVTINGGSLRVNTNGPGAAFTIPTVTFAGNGYLRLDAQMGNDIQLTATTLTRSGSGVLVIVPGVDGNLGNTVGADARVLGTTILGQNTAIIQGLATLNNIGGFSGNNAGATAGSILRLASSTDASASFVSYDPVIGFTTSTGANPLTNTLTGSTSATIANINAATGITGIADVFGLTTTASISGGTLRLRSMNTNDMGALIFNGTSTLSSNLVVNGLAPTVNLTGASTNATTTVTVPSTAGLVVGQPISGPGIPLGATIATIASATTITISAAATATASNLDVGCQSCGRR